MKPVYISDVAAFLPGDPVDNDTIEDRLGRIDNVPSRTKKIVLRNNKILTRHYAIDPNSGQITHTNAQLTAEAVRQLKDYGDIDCLACGTTCPDLLFPGHALMVVGELSLPPIDAVSTHGICISGMTALKYAAMSVATGSSQKAVATGSELASSFMRAAFFTTGDHVDADVQNKPIRAFDADFLRWMLSDGSGALMLTPNPAEDGPSLRIDWIEHRSYAGELETCMYGGGCKTDDGAMIGWRIRESIPENQKRYLYCVRQDIKLLDKHIVPTMGRALADVAAAHNLTPEDIDWYLPHYSSGYFRDKFYEGMQAVDFEIPYDRWFTNLPTKGNTGSAAIFIIIEELFHSGRLKPGQRLLCFIPESARFSHCFMHLTVV